MLATLAEDLADLIPCPGCEGQLAVSDFNFNPTEFENAPHLIVIQCHLCTERICTAVLQIAIDPQFSYNNGDEVLSALLAGAQGGYCARPGCEAPLSEAYITSIQAMGNHYWMTLECGICEFQHNLASIWGHPILVAPVSVDEVLDASLALGTISTMTQLEQFIHPDHTAPEDAR